MRQFFTQLPDESRRAVFAATPDNDGDGVPDFLQRPHEQGSLDASITTTQSASGQVRTVITVNGVTYDSPDQVPPQIADQLRRAGLHLANGTAPGPPRAAASVGPARPQGSPSWVPATPAPVRPEPPSLASISDQSELTRQMLGEAPPRKWWEFWKR